MKSPETVSLPQPLQEYQQINESMARRAVEQALQDLRTDIVQNRSFIDPQASNAVRRHQFLLMGASNG